MPDKTDPVAVLAEMKETITNFIATQTELDATVKSMAEASGKDAKEAVAHGEKLAEKISGFANQLLDLEQSMANAVQVGTAPIQSLGQMVVASDAYKDFAAGNSGRMTVQANTIIGQDGSPLENSSVIVAPQRLPGIVPGAFRALRVSDIIPQGTTNSNLIEYTRELLFTNNAAETNEGLTKPESVLTFELVNAPVVTIAHFIKVSKQVLDDAPMLQSYIDTRMRYGVDLRCDQQLLNGNGTSPNMSGITDAGNHTVFTPTTGENALDSINRMIWLTATADYNATAIILSPADWGAIERLKVNAGTDDRYIIGNPANILGPTLWGLPVVVTNTQSAGNVTVGAFDIAYQQWNRTGTVVEMFEQDDVNVQQNLLTIRAEIRKALAVYRPASVQHGALTL